MARSNIHTRHLRTHAAYVRLLLVEFKWTLLLTAAILVAGSLLFHFFQEDPVRHTHPDYVESLYRTFILMSLNLPDQFPDHPLLRLWCFAVPFLSFAVVSEAVVRLAVLLSSRANSGGRWVKAMVAVQTDHVILCGLGRLGSSILRELRQMGKDVVAIDKRAEAFGVSAAQRLGVPVLLSDARDEQSLIDAGIHKAAAIIAATNDDLANLEIALDARALRPDIRIVMRMFDQRIAEKIARSFDIKLIFNTSAIAAPSFAAATVDRTIVNSFYIDDKQLQTVKLRIGPGSPLVGRTLGHLQEGRQLSILSHRRDNREANLFPPADTRLEENDKVTVLAPSSVVGQLHELNRPAAAP